MFVDVRVSLWLIKNQLMGKTAKMIVLQTEWEIITGIRLLYRQNIAPQNAPATAAAPISIRLADQMCTPA